MAATLLAVGDELTKGQEFAAALEPMGYHLTPLAEPDSLGKALEGGLPELVVLASDIAQTGAQVLLRELKLSEHFNRIGVLLVRPRGLAESRPDDVWIEPDICVEAPPRIEGLLEPVRQLRERVAQRAREGVRFALCVRMPSDLMLLRRIEDLLHVALKPANASARLVWALMQSTREMGLNAIEWGNKGEQDRFVYFALTLYADRFCVTVRDEGGGFNPKHVPHAANPANPLGHIALRENSGMRVGGYGILICRELMDEVRYNEKGNEVTLLKYLKDDSSCDSCQS